jgi:hypothetical protein
MKIITDILFGLLMVHTGAVWAVPFFGDYAAPIAGFSRPWEWASLLFWALFTLVTAYALTFATRSHATK